MTKWIGNTGIEPDTYPKSRLPSTMSTEPTTTNFPSDRVTHRHMSPRGEDNQRRDRPYEAEGNEELKRSGRKVEPYLDQRNYRRPYESHYSQTDGYDLATGENCKSGEFARTKMSHSEDWSSSTGKARVKDNMGFNSDRMGKMGRSG